MGVNRPHPYAWELRQMELEDLLDYAERERHLLRSQKQTAVPRLLNELISRLKQ